MAEGRYGLGRDRGREYEEVYVEEMGVKTDE